MAIILNKSAPFRAIDSNYSAFRIPALAKVGSRIFVFSEGRVESSSDSGQIDIVYCFSDNGGQSWSKITQLVTRDGYTCGNPVPIAVSGLDKIIVMFCTNISSDSEENIIEGTNREPRRVWSLSLNATNLRSTLPVEITDDVREPQTSWFATGPSGGVCLADGTLLCPCNEVIGGLDLTIGGRSFFILSKDNGLSWKRGSIIVDNGGNEGHFAVNEEGKLLHIARCHHPDRPNHVLSVSCDAGASWSVAYDKGDLVTELCKASILMKGKHAVVIAPQNKIRLRGKYRRAGLAFYLINIQKGICQKKCVIDNGLSSYSDLFFTSPNRVAMVWERGVNAPYEEIVFAIMKV